MTTSYRCIQLQSRRTTPAKEASSFYLVLLFVFSLETWKVLKDVAAFTRAAWQIRSCLLRLKCQFLVYFTDYGFMGLK